MKVSSRAERLIESFLQKIDELPQYPAVMTRMALVGYLDTEEYKKLEGFSTDNPPEILLNNTHIKHRIYESVERGISETFLVLGLSCATTELLNFSLQAAKNSIGKKLSASDAEKLIVAHEALNEEISSVLRPFTSLEHINDIRGEE